MSEAGTGRGAGKVALVSGGATGMGVLGADILDRVGEPLAEELGDAARFVHPDVTRPDQWDNAIDHTAREFGGVDVLLHNAGIANGAPVERFPPRTGRGSSTPTSPAPSTACGRSSRRWSRQAAARPSTSPRSKASAAARDSTATSPPSTASRHHQVRPLELGDSHVRVNCSNPASWKPGGTHRRPRRHA